jgi:hypothetical protein
MGDEGVEQWPEMGCVEFSTPTDAQLARKLASEIQKMWRRENASLRAEVARLQAWKESMIAVTPDWQEIGKELGVRLGDSIHDKVLPGIKSLQEQVAQMEKAREGHKNLLDQLHIALNHIDELEKERDELELGCAELLRKAEARIRELEQQK